jgi:hypothetical protein
MESVDLVQPVEAKRPPHGGLFCPLLALSGDAARREQRPFSGVKRTSLSHRKMSANDPKRTSGLLRDRRSVVRQFASRGPVAKC